MPISIAHLPFVMLLTLMVAVPALCGLPLLLPGKLRKKGKKFLFGSLGSAAGILAYQIAYIPVMIAGIIITMPLFWILKKDWIIPAGLILWVYVFWFAALVYGYVSGMRVGWRIGGGASVGEAISKDPLAILGIWLRARGKKK